jgi:hypothetical protein
VTTQINTNNNQHTLDFGISLTYETIIPVSQDVDIIYSFTCPIFACSSVVYHVNKLSFGRLVYLSEMCRQKMKKIHWHTVVEDPGCAPRLHCRHNELDDVPRGATAVLACLVDGLPADEELQQHDAELLQPLVL